MTRQSRKLLICTLTALFLLSVAVITSANSAPEDEHFSVKEYNHFHELLHMLQHEALPRKDFATIRAQAGELTTRGDAIVKLGVPVKVTSMPKFEAELKRFEDALVKFKSDAVDAKDPQLEVSYLAVHDTFENLAAMLPRK
jgi:hypothetical protein